MSAKESAVQNRQAKLAAGVALAITVLIAVGAFVLSYAALYDIALRARLPHTWAWLWPVLVDAPIVQATIALLVLARAGAPVRERAYFWAVLSVAFIVSVSANAAHGVLAEGAALPGWASALVECVPPVVLLAATHGCLLLIRHRVTADGAEEAPETGVTPGVTHLEVVKTPALPTNGSDDEQGPLKMASAAAGQDEPESPSVKRAGRRAAAPENAALAARLESVDVVDVVEAITDSRTKAAPEKVGQVLSMISKSPGLTRREIARQTGLAHPTVSRIVERARAHLIPEMAVA